MIVEDIGLFKLGSVKMSYLSERHKVVANNVANADTPDFAPSDLQPFEKAMKSASVRAQGAGQLSLTDDQHIGGLRTSANFRLDRRFESWEAAPSGNEVVLEQEMLKANETTAQYDLTSQIIRKSGQMMQAAIRFR